MLPARVLDLLNSAHPPTPEDHLVQATCPIEPETPERFLARARGTPRTFWQSGDNWHAGIGQAATIQDPPTDATDRYEHVRNQAHDWNTRRLDNTQAPLRWTGGFAFHDAPEPDPAWDAFGTTRFLLPAFELEHTPNQTRLIAHARYPPDTDPQDAINQTQTALEQAQTLLQQAPPQGPREYAIPQPANATDQTAWTQAVQTALNRIKKGTLRKAVLARYLDLDAEEPPTLDVILGNVRQGNPGTNRFLIEPTPGTAFLGASPELIASVHDTTFRATAVAGSIQRGDTEPEDDALARELATSTKNRDEHTLVVDAMRDKLAKHTDHVEVGRERTILRLARIQHLERELYARLTPDQDVLDTLDILHPTPAVCGSPRQPAKAFLRDHEPFERGWYAGPIGWFNTQGDGAFAPGLRAGLIHDTTWRLFAGAGIVSGSDPDNEWNETRIKLEPFLNAIGHPEAPP